MTALKRHPIVHADLQAAFDWYEDLQPGLGAEFAAEFRLAYRRLAGNSLLYAVRFSNVRRVNLNRFPYGLFYVVRPGEIWLLAVLHGSRDTESVLRKRRNTFK